MVTAVRNQYFDRQCQYCIHGFPVVSVGNLAVGGTGKTPIASWIVSELRRGGSRPAILHGKSGADEALLHYHWTPKVPVLVEDDRRLSLKKAREVGADIAILDDGFQHRRVGRQVDLVVLAAEDDFPSPLLPRGPFREPVSALKRADAVVITRRTASYRDAEELGQRLLSVVSSGCVLGSLRFETARLTPIGNYPGIGDISQGLGPSEEGTLFNTSMGSEAGWKPLIENALVLTAVGRSENVLATVGELTTGSVDMLSFADHYRFTEEDVTAARELAGSRPILVTEKDAVKLTSFAGLMTPCYVVEQQLVWDWGQNDVRSLLQHKAVT